MNEKSIGVLLALGLGAWLLINVILPLLAFFFPMMATTFAIGVFAWICHKSKLHADLNEPVALEQYLSVELRGFNLSVKLDEDAISSYSVSHEMFVGLVTISTAILFFFLSELNEEFFDFPKWKRVLGGALILSFVGLVTWLCVVMTKCTDLIRNRITGAVSKANSKFSTAAGRLSTISSKISCIARNLKVDYRHDETSANLIKFINTNKINLLTNPGQLQTIMKTETEKADDELAKWRHAFEEYQNIQELHRKVSPEVRAYRCRSTQRDFNHIMDEIDGYKMFLGQLQFQDFSEAMLVTSGEIRDIEGHIKNSKASGNKPISAADPYSVLRVTQDMEFTKIKKVFRQLSKIYHPDLGLLPDGEQFSAIDTAFNEIRKSMT